MTKKINAGLFVRLMQTPASARKDILEYIGEGPVAADDVIAARFGPTERPDTASPHEAGDTIRPAS